MQLGENSCLGLGGGDVGKQWRIVRGSSGSGHGVGAAGVTQDQRARVASERDQLVLHPCDLESLLAEDHSAWLVWGYVERQDLHRQRQQNFWRDRFTTAPTLDCADGTIQSLSLSLSLSLYATLQGVGSARALARLYEAHDCYRRHIIDPGAEAMLTQPRRLKSEMQQRVRRSKQGQ